MAVMTAYGARHAHKPVKAAIAAGAALLRALDTETLLKVSGKSPELLRAPAILREVKPAVLPRAVLVAHGRSFSWITDKICGIVEGSAVK